MIKVFFSELIELPDVETIQNKLNELPLLLHQKILAYKSRDQQAVALTGKLLLQKIIDFFSLEIGLEQIQYEANGKPFLESPLQFNLSYSKKVVVCAGTLRGKIGIDVEKVHRLDLNLYESYFTLKEWDNINNHKDRLPKFFKYWTRKEALLKASGAGILNSMQQVEIIEDKINFENSLYYLSKVAILEGYICHLACTIPQHIDVEKWELFNGEL